MRPEVCQGDSGRTGRGGSDSPVKMASMNWRWERASLKPVAGDGGRSPDRAEGVEQGQAGDAFGPVDRDLEGDDAAPVVTDHSGSLNAEGIHEIDDVAGEKVAADAVA